MSVEPIRPTSQPEQPAAFMQALTTEHFTLQTARAVAVSEGNGRTALYVGALSSTLVALALVPSGPRWGRSSSWSPHRPAGRVLPRAGHYVRVLQSSVEDILYARAINGSGTTTPRSTRHGPTTSCCRDATTSAARWPTCTSGLLDPVPVHHAERGRGDQRPPRRRDGRAGRRHRRPRPAAADRARRDGVGDGDPRPPRRLPGAAVRCMRASVEAVFPSSQAPTLVP